MFTTSIRQYDGAFGGAFGVSTSTRILVIHSILKVQLLWCVQCTFNCSVQYTMFMCYAMFNVWVKLETWCEWITINQNSHPLIHETTLLLVQNKNIKDPMK